MGLPAVTDNLFTREAWEEHEDFLYYVENSAPF